MLRGESLAVRRQVGPPFPACARQPGGRRSSQSESRRQDAPAIGLSSYSRCPTSRTGSRSGGGDREVEREEGPRVAGTDTKPCGGSANAHGPRDLLVWATETTMENPAPSACACLEDGPQDRG